MKIVYAGTPQYAVQPLSALVAAGHNVVAVITQQDRPVGRKGVLTPPQVKLRAQELGIPVFQFDKIGEHIPEITALGADVMFTCAYGQLLTQGVLDCFPSGVWNAHASLLPKYRGASPIQAAMLAGEEFTGVTIMRTELALDSGDILLVKRCGILPNETCGELSERLSALSAQAVCEAADILAAGDINLLLQDDSEATYCKKIKKEDARIDFTAPAAKVRALINAMSPSPAAYCTFKGAPLNIYRAEEAEADFATKKCGQVAEVSPRGVIVKCGQGFICITEAQFAGGKRLSAADIRNGRKICTGDMLE